MGKSYNGYKRENGNNGLIGYQSMTQMLELV